MGPQPGGEMSETRMETVASLSAGTKEEDELR